MGAAGSIPSRGLVAQGGMPPVVVVFVRLSECLCQMLADRPEHAIWLDELVGFGEMTQRTSASFVAVADEDLGAAGGPGGLNRSASMIINSGAGTCPGGSSPDPILCRSMVGETTPPSGPQPEGRRAGRAERHVWSAMRVGIALALVGLADGFVMALKSHVAPCPNGTFFPKGTTNFNCYVHPNAGTGIAIAVMSALLGILVVLAAISAAASLRSGSTARGVSAADQQASS